jgi:hypothetical protein
LTVSIPLAGTETVTDPPDSDASTDAIERLLSVTTAVAVLGVKPLNEILALCAEPPEFKKTTTTEPSVFLKAVIPVLETEPDVDTR